MSLFWSVNRREVRVSSNSVHATKTALYRLQFFWGKFVVFNGFCVDEALMKICLFVFDDAIVCYVLRSLGIGKKNKLISLQNSGLFRDAVTRLTNSLAFVN